MRYDLYICVVRRQTVNRIEPLRKIIKLCDVRGPETGIDDGARFDHITKIRGFVRSYLNPNKDKQVVPPSRG